VAIGLPPAVSAYVQGWRERLGDPNAAAIVPHVTLLPPTPLRGAALPAVQEHLAAVASAVRPFRVRLRGTASFRPASPVVYVALVEGAADCDRLQRRVRSGPLERPLRFPYHPHVTVAHDLPDDALDRALAALADYETSFEVGAFSLFERGVDGVWRLLRDFPFDRHGSVTGSLPAGTPQTWQT
jgi:2'-5' RNA ligase